MCIARFTVAVDRRRTKNQAENAQTADFISCVAFGKTGEFFQNFGRKGVKFEIVGRIQTGSYQNKEGQTVYTTEVVVEEAGFAESKKASEANSASPAPAQSVNNNQTQQASDGFVNVPDEIDDELPFN